MRQTTLIKIISVLRNNLDIGLTIMDISKKLKIGYRPAYLHILEMEKEGIINIQKVGNAKQCKLNTESKKTIHLLAEADTIKTEKLLLLNTISKEILEKNIQEVLSIILFGSYAKGTNKKNSDIDLIIILHNIKDTETRKNILAVCTAYHYSHNVQINPTFIDINELRKMLKSKELNIGLEARMYGITLYGAELFWKIINE